MQSLTDEGADRFKDDTYFPSAYNVSLTPSETAIDSKHEKLFPELNTKKFNALVEEQSQLDFQAGKIFV